MGSLLSLSPLRNRDELAPHASVTADNGGGLVAFSLLQTSMKGVRKEGRKFLVNAICAGFAHLSCPISATRKCVDIDCSYVHSLMQMRIKLHSGGITQLIREISSRKALLQIKYDEGRKYSGCVEGGLWEERGDSSDCKSHTHLATFPSFDPFFLASDDRVKDPRNRLIHERVNAKNTSLVPIF